MGTTDGSMGMILKKASDMSSFSAAVNPVPSSCAYPKATIVALCELRGAQEHWADLLGAQRDHEVHALGSIVSTDLEVCAPRSMSISAIAWMA